MTGEGAPLLELAGIEKSYSGIRALRGAHLTISRPGTVHTLTGQNGCGKSSLLGVLSGQLQPDRGQIRFEGRPARFGSASDAVRQGVAMVSQETAVAEDLSVTENVLMGRLALPILLSMSLSPLIGAFVFKLAGADGTLGLLALIAIVNVLLVGVLWSLNRRRSAARPN